MCWRPTRLFAWLWLLLQLVVIFVVSLYMHMLRCLVSSRTTAVGDAMRGYDVLSLCLMINLLVMRVID